MSSMLTITIGILLVIACLYGAICALFGIEYKCKHESNGLMYTSYPPQYKCNKCGEMYR